MAGTHPYEQTFFARGKLMLTGEYLVLDGAEALAVPTQPGQWLNVSFTPSAGVLHWQSLDQHGRTWYEACITLQSVRRFDDRIQRDGEDPVRRRLLKALHYLLTRHPALWPSEQGLRMQTVLEFDRSWGLGSSSTLSFLLAAWGGADAFALNRYLFGGSGYDIACAGAAGPLVYSLKSGGNPRVKRCYWNPDLLNGAWLVYRGRKQNSRTAIEAFRRQPAPQRRLLVSDASMLTRQLLAASSGAEVRDLLRQHEALIGYAIHQPPVKKTSFTDFPGVIKSLGAWGGDFMLVLPDGAGVDVPKYFSAHGLKVCLPARELLCTASAPLPVEPVDASDWPVFLYGPLAEPRRDNQWLLGHVYCEARLDGYELLRHGDDLQPALKESAQLRGTLVYLSPEEVMLLDLHPIGPNYRRTHCTVRVGSRRVRCQVWWPPNLPAPVIQTRSDESILPVSD